MCIKYSAHSYSIVSTPSTYRLYHCPLQLVLNVAVNGHSVQASPATSLPAATSVVTLADSQDRANFNTVAKMKEEPMDVETLENKEEVSQSGQLCTHWHVNLKHSVR